jgi:outer membrane protein TolC
MAFRDRMRLAGAFVSTLCSAVSARGQHAAPRPEPTRAAIEPASAPVIRLARAIDLALARNPTALVAIDEVRRAQAVVEQTRAGVLPSLYGNAGLVQLDGARTQAGIITQPQTSLLLGATLSAPIAAPKPWALWGQSKDRVDVARLSASDTRRLLAIAVARAYLAVVAQKRIIATVTHARDTDRAHYEFAQTRFSGGLGNRLDAVRAAQQWRSDEANLEAEYAALVKQREALGVLAGVGGPLDAGEPSLPEPPEAGRITAQAERRSDVLVAIARLRAARHAVRDDWTDYAPYLTATLTPFSSIPPTAIYPATGWQGQILLTVPFYDAGLRYGQEKERAVLRDEAAAQLEGLLRQARSEARAAYEEVRRADAALVDAQSAAQLAETALELANSAYRNGTATNLEVIDAERTALDAQTAVAVAEDNVRQARLDLLAATGQFP